MAVVANRDARSTQEHVAVEVNRDAERAVERLKMALLS